MKHPVWIALSTVVGILGLVVTLIQMRGPSSPPAQGSDVGLASVAFDVPTALDAEEFPVYDPTDRIATKVQGTTPLDITLLNEGDTAVRFTRIDADVETFESISCLQQGGEMRISAFYSLRIPTDEIGETNTEPRVSIPVDFTVAPGSAERMAITIGPEALPENGAAVIMGVRLKLITSDGGTVDAGLVALTTDFSSQVNSNFIGSYGAPCARRGLASIDGLLAKQPVASGELIHFREGLQSLL